MNPPALEYPSSGVRRLTAKGTLRRAQAGFSLVEVTLAIGVVAFAFVALFGLVPAGLNTFRQAMDTSVGAQIAQRVVSDAQETDFDVLVRDTPEEKNKGKDSQFYRLPLRYFDDQGNEIPVANPNSPTSAESLKILYSVRVRGSNPGKADPAQHRGDYFTSLPQVSGTRFNPRDLTVLTVQIATNPAGKDLKTMIDSSTFLVSPDLARKANVPLQTYSVAIARTHATAPK